MTDGYSRNRVRRCWPLECAFWAKKSGTAEDVKYVSLSSLYGYPWITQEMKEFFYP